MTRNKTIGSAHAQGAIGGESWYREGVNFYPKDELFSQDRIDELIKKNIIFDVPQEKPFNKNSKILALGSCFARELQQELKKYQQQMDHLWMPSGLNNTFALRQFIQWVVTGEKSRDAYWYDQHEKGGAVKWQPNSEREKYLDYFKSCNGFVFTLGLAEVWKDIKTGGVFWRGVPGNKFDPEKHKFSMSSVPQNHANIYEVTQFIRTISEAPIIFTLSPVPLRASFRQDMPCFVSDCVSKSTLRVALFEFFENGYFEGTHYYPSYEIVKWLGPHLDMPVYSDEKRDCRHVNRGIVKHIISNFMEHYFE